LIGKNRVSTEFFEVFGPLVNEVLVRHSDDEQWLCLKGLGHL
jgi:hypothetical protein